MAMSGSYKGIRLHYKGNKSLVLMLLLTFSAALFGVMAVQKLREKQALNILLKEKDKELYALRILLQKESDQAWDIRRKAEEMKGVIDTLSIQKRDFDGWIPEMESMVISLKEDNQAMATVLEDRANEIRTLHETEMDISKKESEKASLREIARMKEVEIEDLRRRLDSSMQESKARQENVARAEEKQRSENAEHVQGSSDEDYDQNRGRQDNSDKGSRDQQSVIRGEVNIAGDDRGNAAVVGAGESNGGADRGNSEGVMKFAVADGADKVLAQRVRRRGAQLSRKRLKVIARNRRMGKRGNWRIVGHTQEDQARGGNVGEQLATETGIMNRGFGSTVFNDVDESIRVQSKVDTSSESSQDKPMGKEAASNAGEVSRAEEENRYGDGEDGVKQPRTHDAGSKNSKDQGENTDTPEMTANGGNSPAEDEMAWLQNDDSVESTGSSRDTEPKDLMQYEANNNWNSFQATSEEKEEEKTDEPEF